MMVLPIDTKERQQTKDACLLLIKVRLAVVLSKVLWEQNFVLASHKLMKVKKRLQIQSIGSC